MATEQDIDDDLDGGDALEGLEAKKVSGKKIVLFAAGGFVALLILGVAGFILLGSQKNDAKTASETETVQLIFIDLPELVVNLNTGERQPQFLRARISLEVDRASARAEVEAKMPRVIDDFQVYLRELRAQDLNGSAGLYRLKEELLVRINRSVAPAEVKDVLFREMLVQ